MNMSVDNYDELVLLQREYSDKILKDNEDSKILNFINSPILSGFVYLKVDKARELGIDVEDCRWWMFRWGNFYQNILLQYIS